MQQFGQSFILALKSLKKSKMRAFLTMLGIIIGISAVIVITSIGNGMQTYMNDAFRSMGTNLLTVSVSQRGTRSVDSDDMYELADNNKEFFSAVSPNVAVSGNVKKGTTETGNFTPVTGVSEDYADMLNYKITSGRFIRYMDTNTRHKVCVIGTYVADTLFGKSDPVGDTLKINGNTFTVIGVLDEIGDSTEYSSDNCVYIPYTSAMQLMNTGTISQYSFAVADENRFDEAKQIIKDTLYGIFGSDDFYDISSLADMLDMMNEMMGTVITVLSAIAAISLAVGGVGIMNIMLVSVTERTREIGIRKSLGAKRRHILSQFVIEAMTLSALGGIIGMCLGVAISFPVGTLFDLTAVPKLSTIIMAFTVSVAIGVIFGYLPASKASKLNPIDALHHE